MENKDVTVGIFKASNDKDIPIKLFGVLYQADDNTFLIPRGGNFLINTMVETGYSDLSMLLENSFTANNGLEQPDVNQVPVPSGRVIKWFVDYEYEVIGFGFLLIGSDSNIILYDNKEQAILALKIYQDSISTTITPNNKKIDLIIYQSCSNDDGVHFKIYPYYDKDNWKDYIYTFINMGNETDAILERIDVNEIVIKNHDNHKNGYFKVIVSHNTEGTGVYESYSSTCNHDGQPTNCLSHTNNINIGDKQQLKIGQLITAIYEGQTSCDNGINWYNKNTETDLLEGNGITGSFKVTSLPVILHAQPNCKGCHGWTELLLH